MFRPAQRLEWRAHADRLDIHQTDPCARLACRVVRFASESDRLEQRLACRAWIAIGGLGEGTLDQRTRDSVAPLQLLRLGERRAGLAAGLLVIATESQCTYAREPIFDRVYLLGRSDRQRSERREVVAAG